MYSYSSSPNLSIVTLIQIPHQIYILYLSNKFGFCVLAIIFLWNWKPWEYFWVFQKVYLIGWFGCWTWLEGTDNISTFMVLSLGNLLPLLKHLLKMLGVLWNFFLLKVNTMAEPIKVFFPYNNTPLHSAKGWTLANISKYLKVQPGWTPSPLFSHCLNF